MNKTNAVLLLFLLLIFAAPVVGQEAGQRARGETVPGILGSVDPMSRIEGVITPDLQQLEMGDGTIIARDDLIDPEYFVIPPRPNLPVTVLLGGVAGVVAKVLVDQIEGPLARAALGTLLPGEDENENEDDDYSGSYTEAVGLGMGLSIPLWVAFPLYGGEWKPW